MSLTVQVDTREKPDKIDHIIDYFEAEGIYHFRSKLPVGDYMNLDNARFVIDRKQNLQEVCGNLCQGHERFRQELIRAQRLGIKLALLIEHGRSIKTLDDVRYWRNPRRAVSPYALDGLAVYKRLMTISSKYDVDIHFCNKKQTGELIVQLLTNNGKTY